MSQSLGTMFDLSANAGADLSTHVFKAVKWEAGQVNRVILCGAGDRAAGVLQNKPQSGEAAAVRFAGTTKCLVDGNAGAIAVGAALKPDANGKGVATAVDGDEVFGFAMEASTADNDIIEVQLVNRQR